MADEKVVLEANTENCTEFADVLVNAFKEWHDKKGNPFLHPDVIIYTVCGFLEHLLDGGPCPACRQKFIAQAADLLMQTVLQMGSPKHAVDEVRH